MQTLDTILRDFPPAEEIRTRLAEACREVRTLKELLKVAERRSRIRVSDGGSNG